MEPKCCSRCQEVKPRTEFERHQSAKDGLRGYCKVCKKAEKKRYYLKYPEKKRALRRRCKSTKVRNAIKKKERYHNDPVYREKKKEVWRQAQRLFPEKVRARRQLQRAVRAGRIPKFPCPCGNPNSQGHHEDYSKPFEVVWMCASCHMKEHERKKQPTASPLTIHLP